MSALEQVERIAREEMIAQLSESERADPDFIAACTTDARNFAMRWQGDLPSWATDDETRQFVRAEFKAYEGPTTDFLWDDV